MLMYVKLFGPDYTAAYTRGVGLSAKLTLYAHLLFIRVATHNIICLYCLHQQFSEQEEHIVSYSKTRILSPFFPFVDREQRSHKTVCEDG